MKIKRLSKKMTLNKTTVMNLDGSIMTTAKAGRFPIRTVDLYGSEQYSCDAPLSCKPCALPGPTAAYPYCPEDPRL